MSQASPVRLVKKEARGQQKYDKVDAVEEFEAVCDNMRAAFLNLARQMEILKSLAPRLKS
jgi:cell fate (sporulation/competence/biofilm development) regulator YmcA (YheA/YmcA/DUF963 family)